MEPARYYPQIEQLFRSDPAFVHFVPPAVISDSLELTAVPMVTLQVINAKDYFSVNNVIAIPRFQIWHASKLKNTRIYSW